MGATTTDARLGCLHCLGDGLRELLACNVIVFDAVILQCRACTHASAARVTGVTGTSRRSVAITAVLFLLPRGCRASRCFFDVTPRSSTGLSLFGSHLPSRASFPSRQPTAARDLSTSRFAFPPRSPCLRCHSRSPYRKFRHRMSLPPCFLESRR